MNFKTLIVVFLFFKINAFAQQAWPSTSWTNATNLTSILGSGTITELSGLHWNPVKNQLFTVGDGGHVIILQLNTSSNTFSLLANKSVSGGPEGITQANYNDNEFYIIDEDNYQINKYTNTANYSSVTLANHWDLLASPSTMTDTGNTGPEGIVFIPDSNLSTAGFISQQTGGLYTSVKGAGGLFFVAHQDAGYVWVFDINPNVNDDFAFVGKYKTNATESCDLSFDRSTNLLYILHNISNDNTLETTNLSTTIPSGTQRKFVTLNQYDIVTPVGDNENIEGFTLTPKCFQTGGEANVSAWLCRDVSSSESSSLRADTIRQFSPFVADGTCTLAVFNENSDRFLIYPNPAQNRINIQSQEQIKVNSIQIIDNLGQVIINQETNNIDEISVDVSNLSFGVYFIKINTDNSTANYKFLKN